MTRGEELFTAWALVAFLVFVPYTATFGGLDDRKRRAFQIALTVFEIVWAAAWLWIWRHP